MFSYVFGLFQLLKVRDFFQLHMLLLLVRGARNSAFTWSAELPVLTPPLGLSWFFSCLIFVSSEIFEEVNGYISTPYQSSRHEVSVSSNGFGFRSCLNMVVLV